MRNRPKDGASSAACKTCGATIYWATKPGGGWHRPLEQYCVEDLITVTDGRAHLTHGWFYRVHVCDPAQVAALAEARARYVPQSAHLLTEVAVACPRCGAEVGETCRTLSESHRKQYGDHLRVAHPARQKAAEEAMQPPV